MNESSSKPEHGAIVLQEEVLSSQLSPTLTRIDLRDDDSAKFDLLVVERANLSRLSIGAAAGTLRRVEAEVETAKVCAHNPPAGKKSR